MRSRDKRGMEEDIGTYMWQLYIRGQQRRTQTPRVTVQWTDW